ncbi:efflux RND transporter periplasmic adaptor subunit [Desertifilum sp. FACHB-1129]|uniref:Efflux transporter periplasmic adaptor subunit n=1 Tax=Desertifilum tharense IPPAS B-1220 TaxID=1781255 RepID=A0A1E5QDK4_9CYAN|nr:MULTISPECIES: efflux RND transporter periplasmic adaptor subunit [Desertifilum]MDA0212016.1 efflux RND transporter periplasmic adaptor subunit [Cyanobacteria bacterium FC1]MBD2315092.1 efflux RND transporter periplasmic adaptor subunit [Desertifilum sp. FACHB-1129]MBD2324926.1 efflux RND transporter periplasmic adaptor subunit [Desertifilum sp. FACHB-866]MBD2335019.1 efflux RND transporter periplasmic adaptor subunit [Desertifilum sp. FACHB-868]OEJ72746.1 efflux transporter periplasmic adap
MQLPLVNPKFVKQTPWLVGLVAAAIVGGTGVTAIVMRANAPRTNIVEELTVPVRAQDLTIRISANGTVQPAKRVNLSPKLSGRLAEVYVEQGQKVQRGEIIARMESAEIEAQLSQAQARLASAQANLDKVRTGSRPEDIAEARARVNQAQASLAQVRAGSRSEEVAEARAALTRAEAQVTEARSRLDLASERVRRNQYLASEGAITRDDLDVRLDEERRARAALDQQQALVSEARQRLDRIANGSRPEEIAQAQASVAEAQSRLDALANGSRSEDIARAEAEVQEAQANVRFYEVQLEDTKVRAPFDGLVVQKYADAGSFVTPATSASDASSATSTSVVAIAEGLEVLAKVPEADISQIRSGQTVEIVADAFPNEVFQGNVRLVAPEAIRERDVTLFQVRVVIDTGLDQLQSGMNVDLKFLGEQLEDALVVPTVAIVTNRGQTGVLIPDANNQPQFKPVAVGSTIGNQIQILDGLQTGDRVFVELPPGQRLENIIRNEMQ